MQPQSRRLRRVTTRRGKNLVPMAAIRRLAQQIAERFQPDQIILFGSYAYGEPNQHIDVDLLVVIPARDEISQAVRIREAALPHDSFSGPSRGAGFSLP